MSESMRPRGPDGQGTLVRDQRGFSHRRLKIIDLSEASQQPMVDSQLGLSIVFNGAIYNYPELKKELQAKGYSFFSSGDTEVLLKSYHAWGPEFVQRLNGMFALAITERDSGRVILARDRLGIKPLYYAKGHDSFRFASTTQALLDAGDIDTEIDPTALHYYLTFHSIAPPPYTILKGIRKLPPGAIAVIEADGTFSQSNYWDLSFGPNEEERNFSEADWKEKTLTTLRDAVNRRMIADVPVGVLLSGGVDSSLIVGLLAESRSTPVDTFSIGFESIDQEKGDEFEYSDLIAKRFSTRHHKLQIPSKETLSALQACVRHMSEPMVSHDNVGFYLLSQEVAKHVKVVQSGQGADELFAGYHWYPPMMKTSTDGALETYSKAFFDRNFEEYLQTVDSKLATDDVASRFVSDHFNRPGAPNAIDRALRLDTQVMLVDDPVKRVDNHTMAASLEARVPFLDHEVVELAARIPAELKVKGDGKYILKEAAREVIPSEVIDRPKGYFPVPALKYLRGDFLALSKDALTNHRARERGLFNSQYVQRLLDEPEAHITPLQGSKLWQLALLEIWLQTHNI